MVRHVVPVLAVALIYASGPACSDAVPQADGDVTLVKKVDPKDAGTTGDGELDTGATSEVPPIPPAGAPDAGPSPTPAAACDLTKPFGNVAPLAVNTTAYETGARLSADELTLYFTRVGTNGQVFVAKRPDRISAFTGIKKVTAINTTADDGNFGVTQDDLRAYFASSRGDARGLDIFTTTRTSAAAEWGNVTRLGGISSAQSDDDPFVLPDGRAVYFDSARNGHDDIFRASIDETGKVGKELALGATINTTAKESNAVVSKDDLTIYFARAKSGADQDIWVATRPTVDAEWGDATKVAELNSGADDRPGWISLDGCRMYISSERGGGAGSSDLYMASRPQ